MTQDFPASGRNSFRDNTLQTTTEPIDDIHADPVFYCKGKNVKILLTVLKTVNFKSKALCCITPHGLKLTVEDSKAMQAHAYIQKTLFSEFYFRTENASDASTALNAPTNDHNAEQQPNQDQITFTISLDTLLDCIALLGTPDTSSTSTPSNNPSNSTIVEMSLGRDMSELMVKLSEHGVTATCALTTYEPENAAELEELFREGGTINKIIMNSGWMKDALGELHSASQKLTILVSPNAPFFRLSANSITGETQMDYPKNTDILESFQCRESAQFSYRFSLVTPMLKALSDSSKLSLRMNSYGIMSIQLMIPVTDKENSFVEFLWVPLVEDDE